MAFIQVLPAANRSGTLSTGTRNLPATVNGAALRVDALPFAGKSRPFSDPTMEIRLTISFSWDGGATFPESGGTSAFGNPTGWGKSGTDNPMFARDVPFNSNLGGRPNRYRADLEIINGPITFGLSIDDY